MFVASHHKDVNSFLQEKKFEKHAMLEFSSSV